ncbi:cupin domain-containing protein [Streptomyces sp. NPDC088387]|uniref:cupin domain-containing protein n=1 Tax=Streptomyces sp. NPDC088387 TaxID=3365859 RepID=UPI00381256DF
MTGAEVTPEDIAARYGLEPLPVEGGLFRQTWAGPADETGRPTGTAIIALLTPADFSALHRLPTTEIWHFYAGDPLHLLLLSPDGTDRLVELDKEGEVQTVVPPGTWMGARPAPGGRWSLFGTTMAPGFLPDDYDGADDETVARLCARHPHHTPLIRSLHRPHAPTRMAEEAPDE